jgi:hypothetical protein
MSPVSENMRKIFFRQCDKELDKIFISDVIWQVRLNTSYRSGELVQILTMVTRGIKLT